MRVGRSMRGPHASGYKVFSFITSGRASELFSLLSSPGIDHHADGHGSAQARIRKGPNLQSSEAARAPRGP